jgi:hypothetical protein
MAANIAPIFSRYADNDGGSILTTGASDFNGQNVNNLLVWAADKTNGGFIQKLRFKALGTNVTSTARIYINNGSNPRITSLAAVTGTPTGTPSASGGTLMSGNYYAKIYAIDQWGGYTAASTESAAVVVTGPTGSIAWAWTAVTGAASYEIQVAYGAAGAQNVRFSSTTNSYSQTTAGTLGLESDTQLNNYFFGELLLPATTVVSNTATTSPDMEYPMNIAMNPGHNILVGLSVTVAAGWSVAAIAGMY